MGNGGSLVSLCGLILVWMVAALAAGRPTAEAWRIRRRVPAPVLRFDKDGSFKIVQVGRDFLQSMNLSFVSLVVQ